MLQRLKTIWNKHTMKTWKGYAKEVSQNTFKITFCEKSPELASVLATSFSKIPAIEVIEGDILKLAADAIVSPANSFGDMSGGLDKAIDDFYKGTAQSMAMEAIRDQYHGELPVGNAIILNMRHQQFPHLIIAPTMRIPGRVDDTINAYLAMRALLTCIIDYNLRAEQPILHIAMTSLCTGIGRMPYQKAAEQMLVAYDMIIHQHWKQVMHPAMAPYAYKN